MMYISWAISLVAFTIHSLHGTVHILRFYTYTKQFCISYHYSSHDLALHRLFLQSCCKLCYGYVAEYLTATQHAWIWLGLLLWFVLLFASVRIASLRKTPPTPHLQLFERCRVNVDLQGEKLLQALYCVCCITPSRDSLSWCANDFFSVV